MQLKRIAYSVLATVALSGVVATSASANTFINFDQDNASSPTGYLEYAGGNSRLEGRGIRFDSISLQDTDNPSNNQSVTCTGCILAFNTGANTAQTSNSWTFAADDDGSGSNGTFLVRGQAKDSMGNIIANSGDPNGLLVTGTFTEESLVNLVGGKLFFNGAGEDTKNADLLNFFGVDPNTSFNFANNEISAKDQTIDENGGFKANVNTADLTNEFQNASVPEPQELGIFGLGLALLLIGVFSRRRFSNDLS